ncbi:Down syndrome critical region protein 3 [Phytophthora boehmeriae]|uniref:Down syndrome critical region protein 3 n=1 Tax=Phytophthora boehmeriae TaxID=109152 RepID=A0A8T1WY88_9STRA|nr:Down syndrome critical region protein 3 [Phytophthora boehmeriae]
MTLSRHVEINAPRFRRELLFVRCKNDKADSDRVKQLHNILPSPTDKMMSPVSKAIRAQRTGRLPSIGRSRSR